MSVLSLKLRLHELKDNLELQYTVVRGAYANRAHEDWKQRRKDAYEEIDRLNVQIQETLEDLSCFGNDE